MDVAKAGLELCSTPVVWEGGEYLETAEREACFALTLCKQHANTSTFSIHS